MKKILSTIIMTAMMLVILAISATAAQLLVNGELKELPAYNIKNNNYFKLRDVATILNGTEAQFDVQWNEDSQTINLVTKTAYSGNETIDPTVIPNAVARSSNSSINRDGIPVLLKAYNINFNNYFKLRDLGALLNFNVTWDEGRQLIGIDTKSPYEYPGYAGTDLALNTKYIGLLGKRKGEIDAILGTPEHFSDPRNYIDYYIYPNGIRADYGLFITHTDNSPLYNISSIKLSDLFFNCPETVTVEQVEKLFVESVSTDEYLNINYCGKTLGIKFNNGVAKADDPAVSISVNGAFHSTMTEIVYVGAEWKNTVEKTEGRIAHEFVIENFKSFTVPGGKTFMYEDMNFALLDISGDGINELLVNVYDYDTDIEYYGIYVKSGDKYKYAFGGTDIQIVHNYIDDVYYILEREYIDGEGYYESTSRYYSWIGMNKKLVLETISGYKNETDYIYYNGVSPENCDPEKRDFYYMFSMFYPMSGHGFHQLILE